MGGGNEEGSIIGPRPILIPVITVLFILTQVAVPTQVQAIGGDVGVLNIPPAFQAIEIKRDDGTFRIKLEIADINGNRDIQSVQVDILDTVNARRAAFAYTQFNATDNSIIDEFKNQKDDWLVKSSSSVNRSNVGDVFSTKCVLNLTFVFHPGEGSWIRIILKDKFGANATSKVPYTLEGVFLPEPLRSPYATVTISFAVALSVTAIVIRGRYASNVLAITVEKRMRRHKTQKSIEEIIGEKE